MSLIRQDEWFHDTNTLEIKFEGYVLKKLIWHSALQESFLIQGTFERALLKKGKDVRNHSHFTVCLNKKRKVKDL